MVTSAAPTLRGVAMVAMAVMAVMVCQSWLVQASKFMGHVSLLGGELPTNRKWVSSPQENKWINPTKISFITGVISHLLSGMSHQVAKSLF